MTTSHDKARAERWARNNRITAAQEGVVKALEEMIRQVNTPQTTFAAVMRKGDKARVALDELRAARGGAPPMTEEETESEERQGAADARRESLEDPLD